MRTRTSHRHCACHSGGHRDSAHADCRAPGIAGDHAGRGGLCQPRRHSSRRLGARTRCRQARLPCRVHGLSGLNTGRGLSVGVRSVTACTHRMPFRYGLLHRRRIRIHVRTYAAEVALHHCGDSKSILRARQHTRRRAVLRRAQRRTCAATLAETHVDSGRRGGCDARVAHRLRAKSAMAA